MTREKEIENMATYYAELVDKEYDISPLRRRLVKNAYWAGANWADEHPNLESLWHDASEEPKEDMDILFISKNGYVHKASKIDNCLYGWLKDNKDIKKWAYISDLLPKGGEK